jgi:hypothetical protein
MINQVNISIPDLYQEAFGIYARIPLFFLGDAAPEVNTELGSETYLVAPSGVAVWDRFGFKHPKLSGIHNYEDMYFMPVITTAEISEDKNVVLTDVIGSKGGTVKELMSNGDQVITFRGLVMNLKSKVSFPELAVQNLNTLFDFKESIPVVSKFLNNCHGITDVVFIKKQWLGMEGYPNVIKFEFIALSDQNIVLELAD